MPVLIHPSSDGGQSTAERLRRESVANGGRLEPEDIVVLRGIVQTARSVTSLGRAFVLLLHVAMIFVAAYFLRPDVSRIKDVLNIAFE